jgi:hypothetical protein
MPPSRDGAVTFLSSAALTTGVQQLRPPIDPPGACELTGRWGQQFAVPPPSVLAQHGQPQQGAARPAPADPEQNAVAQNG